MNLKISHQVAIESARQNFKTKDLQLLGIEPLSLVNDSLDMAIKGGAISNNNLFSALFDFNDTFFYHAEKVVKGSRSILERGVAHLIKDDNDNILLRRLRSTCFYKDNDINPSFSPFPLDLYVSGPDEHLIISSTIPPSYIELLYEQNAVITSCDSFIPQSVKLDQNSVLGRVKDEIRSLSFKDFSSLEDFQDSIVDVLSTYKNQIVLGCSKLNMKSKRGVISSSIFQVNPTSNPPAKKGTLIYDENSNNLKYYDGAKWRTLVYKEDE